MRYSPNKDVDLSTIDTVCLDSDRFHSTLSEGPQCVHKAKDPDEKPDNLNKNIVAVSELNFFRASSCAGSFLPTVNHNNPLGFHYTDYPKKQQKRGDNRHHGSTIFQNQVRKLLLQYARSAHGRYLATDADQIGGRP